MPVPRAQDWADLNERLLAASREDEQRLIGERQQRVGEGMMLEREHLLPFPEERFELAEMSYPVVDTKGCVRVRTNFYSTPLRAVTVCRRRARRAGRARVPARFPRSH